MKISSRPDHILRRLRDKPAPPGSHCNHLICPASPRHASSSSPPGCYRSPLTLFPFICRSPFSSSRVASHQIHLLSFLSLRPSSLAPPVGFLNCCTNSRRGKFLAAAPADLPAAVTLELVCKVPEVHHGRKIITESWSLEHLIMVILYSEPFYRRARPFVSAPGIMCHFKHPWII